MLIHSIPTGFFRALRMTILVHLNSWPSGVRLVECRISDPSCKAISCSCLSASSVIGLSTSRPVAAPLAILTTDRPGFSRECRTTSQKEPKTLAIPSTTVSIERIVLRSSSLKVCRQRATSSWMKASITAPSVSEFTVSSVI